nr:ECA oligosaccharide polymerase [Mycoavidus sp. B2-EB]
MLWLAAGSFIFALVWREFRLAGFNLNLCFSLAYLSTFYLGFPLSGWLVLYFGLPISPPNYLAYALLLPACFYAIYYVVYKAKLPPFWRGAPLPAMKRKETHLLWVILMLIAVAALLIFILNNGFLFFSPRSYGQRLFSKDLVLLPLKRLFYFFIPAMLVLYFLRPSFKSWVVFLAMTMSFGVLTYFAVGGTRANIALSFALFLFIGIANHHIRLRTLLLTGGVAIGVMTWLALQRYGLKVQGAERIETLLYLTRDTFSPWESLALLLEKYHQIDFQGLAPIIRDFYVYIPQWLWPERPNLVLNTANYFTWQVREYFAVAISPTLIGSLLIMGGAWSFVFGAMVVGLIIKWLDGLYTAARHAQNRYTGATMQAFCFGLLFHLVVLAREGLDSFVSRLGFYCLIFGLCLLLAKLLYRLYMAMAGLRRREEIGGA